MSFLLALLLSAPTPPPPRTPVGPELRASGVSLGTVSVLDCRGFTCTQDGGVGTLTVTASGSSDAGATVFPACAGGRVLSHDGGTLYCTSIINTATLASAATALAANPADCSSGQYANAIAASGDLSCSAVATSQLSGTITNAQLASSYSGVGACGSHQWSSTLNANAAPSCTQPGYSDLSGCEPGQGVTGALQYNSGGCEGGVTNLTSDGTNPIVTGVAAHPATPSLNVVHYDLRPTPSFPAFPFERDNFMTTPMPLGVADTFVTGLGNNWTTGCVKMLDHTSSALVATNMRIPTASNWASSTGGSMSNATLISRLFWIAGSTTLGFQTTSLSQPSGTTLSGNAFIFWTRVAQHATTTHANWFFGLSTLVGGYATAQPSQIPNSIYAGCDDNGDAGNTALHACSNDSTGSATCVDLGGSFPCRTNDMIYDVWIAAAPNYALIDGGRGISFHIENVDAGLVTDVILTNDFPDSGTQLQWLVEGNPGDAGTAITAYFGAACLANSL